MSDNEKGFFSLQFSLILTIDKYRDVSDVGMWQGYNYIRGFQGLKKKRVTY